MADLGTATNKEILDLFNMMKDDSLILKPNFQRKLVWNDRHKENFIETILRGLPFPEIYLAAGEIDLKSQKSTTLVVDGQQRLSTIYQYIIGSKEFDIRRIKSFSELSVKEQTAFFDYKVVVRHLGRIDDGTIIDIFKRINSVQYALNAMEIKNALYEGEFISTAQKFVEDDESLKELDLFTETEYSRMRDVEFILLLMATYEEGGYFSGTAQIENYVTKFDENYPNKSEINSIFEQIFELILNCNLEPDSIWFRKSNMFTLVVELFKFLRESGKIPIADKIKEILLQFEEELYKNKTKDISENEFAHYYYYVYQGTTGRKGRILRGKLLNKYLSKIN